MDLFAAERRFRLREGITHRKCYFFCTWISGAPPAAQAEPVAEETHQSRLDEEAQLGEPLRGGPGQEALERTGLKATQSRFQVCECVCVRACYGNVYDCWLL